MRVRGEDLKPGDVIEVWWRPHRDRVKKIHPYAGPLDFCIGWIEFDMNPTGMTITQNQTFNVLNREE